MVLQEVVDKFVSSGIYPSKYTISDVLGISVGTLRRRGIVVRELQRLYKDFTIKENNCLFCGNPCKSSNKFCNNSCAAKYNNKLRSKGKKYCLCCSTEIKGRAKFCSMECYRKYEYEFYIDKWLSGEVVECNSKTVPTPIRRYLFIKHEAKCALCGWGEINPVTGKTPLEVEHIDGNSENNKPENLTLLCPNCHSLTPTYKALNKGKGRRNRRARYHEGKSY